MDEEQVGLPLTGGVESRDQSGKDPDHRVDATRVGTNDVLEPTHDLVLGLEGKVASAESVGEQQVHPHEDEEDQAEYHREADFGDE